MPVDHCQSAQAIVGVFLLLVATATANDHAGDAVKDGQGHQLKEQSQLPDIRELVAADGEGCKHSGTAASGPCQSKKLRQSDLRKASGPPGSIKQPDRIKPPHEWGYDASTAAQTYRRNESLSPIDDLLHWVKALPGAQINIAVRESPGAGRAVFSTGHIQKGQLLLAVPIDAACFQHKLHGGDGTNEVFAVHLYEAMSDPEHYLQHYFASLPTRQGVLCPWADMPKEYLFMLQSDILELLVLGYQMTMRDFWDLNKDELLEDYPSITYEDLKYLRSLLSTRLFGHNRRGGMLCPLLDMANHHFNCPNSYSPGPCPSAPDKECLMFFAGAYIAPGDEVCIGYKYNMLNDRSMLQYGFLQSAPADLLLHGIDRHDFNRSTLWMTYDEEEFGPPLFEPESLLEAEGEVAQLKMRLERLEALNPLVDHMTAADGDPNGELLAMMRQWRQQRQAALQIEVDRMQGVVAAMKRGATENAESQEAGQEPATFGQVTADLMHWLVGNGAQVSPHLSIGTSHIPGAGAGLLATDDIPSGSVLAVIPLNLTLPVYSTKLLADVPFLLSSLTDPRSPHKAYWDAIAAASNVAAAAAASTAAVGVSSAAESAEYDNMPEGAASEMVTAGTGDSSVTTKLSNIGGTSFYNLPLDYLPLLQHKPTENFIRQTRAATLGHPMAQKQQLLRWLQPSDLPRLLSLVASRAVPFELQGLHMVPLYDLANHREGCPHTLQVVPCKDVHDSATAQGSKQLTVGADGGEATANGKTPYCVVWRAEGEDIAAGSEICASYGSPLLSDDALLQYGFFLNTSTTSGPGSLYPMDQAGFIPGAFPWQSAAATQQSSSSASTGTLQQQQDLERARLHALLQQLDDVNTVAASMQPADDDPNGEVLGAVIAWRQQRRSIVLAELLKLEQQPLAVE